MAVLARLADVILHKGAGRVAVTGPDGAGKTRVAAGLAEVLRARGAVVVLASVDDFHNPRAVRYARGRGSPEGFYRDTTDMAGLRAALLDPLAPGGDRKVRTRIFDHRRDAVVVEAPQTVPPGAILVLEGIFLIRPALAGAFDLTIFLDVPIAETFARMAARDGSDPDPFAPGSERYRRGQEIWFAEEDPKAQADIVIDNRDFAAPKLVAMRGRAC